MESIHPDSQVFLIGYAIKLLKYFLNNKKTRLQILKSNIFEKILSVYHINWKGVSSFIEELIN